MLRTCAFAATCGWLALSSSAIAADVTIEFRHGRVTIDAHDAAVGDILAAWKRVGQTTIIGADRIVGPLITLQILDAPESDALDIVLRQCSGYVTATRQADSPRASIFERILIVATSSAAAAPARTSAPGPPSPAVTSEAASRASPSSRRAASGPATGMPRSPSGPPSLPEGRSGKAPIPVFVPDPEEDPPEDPPASSATPWFPAEGLSRVPGFIAPSRKPGASKPPTRPSGS
jgi:hypothetical protein